MLKEEMGIAQSGQQFKACSRALWKCFSTGIIHFSACFAGEGFICEKPR